MLVDLMLPAGEKITLVLDDTIRSIRRTKPSKSRGSNKHQFLQPQVCSLLYRN